MPGWAVEGPDGVAGPPTRPPVVVAGVDAAGNIRRILTDTTGAQHIVIDSGSVATGGLTDTQLRASAVPVSLATLPALAAGSAVIGHVIVDTAPSTAVTNTGTFAVQAAATLAAETTKVIGTVNIASGQTVGLAAGAAVIGHVIVDSGTLTANAGTNLNTSALALDASVTQVQASKAAVLPAKGAMMLGSDYAGTPNTQVPKVDSSGIQFVQGNAASGASVAGNPVPIGGDFNTAPPTLLNGQRGTAQLDSRAMQMVSLWDATGATRTAVLTQADGAAKQNALAVYSTPMLWNGASLDIQRANSNGTTGDTGAKSTGAFLGAAQTNFNARGAVITCILGTVTGAVTTWQTGIQWSYDGGTNWLELTPLGANDTAAANGKTYTWIVYPTNTSQAAGTTPTNLVPGTISVAGPNQLNVINAALPRTWRFAAQVSVVTSISISAVYINYIV